MFPAPRVTLSTIRPRDVRNVPSEQLQRAASGLVLTHAPNVDQVLRREIFLVDRAFTFYLFIKNVTTFVSYRFGES